ncbi:type II secretion system F family protein [Lentzea chajnantorensis]
MVGLLLLATALLVWPHVKPIRRLRPAAARGVPVPKWFWVLAAAVAVYLTTGLGGLVAAAVVAVTVGRIVRRIRRERSQNAATEALSNGLGGVVDELRAGAHAAAAAEGAAQDTPAPANEVLRTAAAASRRGGDVERALRELDQPLLRTAVDQLARAWHVSARHGVALADVLDATKADLDRRLAFARQVRARMAGPRASALVLAGLPVFGVLLGELSGARPLGVLTGTAAGQVLLVVGAVLLATGLWWTKRITEP